jgi:hypothetical protein
VSGVPPPPFLPRTRGNPGISPDSSDVVVVLVVEGFVWYAAIRSARSVVGLLRMAQRWRVILVLVDLSVSTFLLFLVSFGFGCVAAPSCLLYRVVIILI